MTPESNISSPPSSALFVLVHSVFENLSLAERSLLSSLELGTLSGSFVENADSKPESKILNTRSSDRSVRADLIRWLLLEPTCQHLLKEHGGLRLANVSVSGQLRLEDIDADFPIVLESCQFCQPVNLVRGQFRYLSLARSSCVGVLASGILVRGDLDLKGLRVEGGVSPLGVESLDRGRQQDAEVGNKDSFSVSFDDARITGVVDCQGAVFLNAGGYSLSAARAKIDGEFNLSSVTSTGQVRINDCYIGATLNCENSSFKSIGSGEYGAVIALDLERANIGGHCLLRGKEFTIRGTASLRHTRIRGQLDCDDARFLEPESEHQNSPYIYGLDGAHMDMGGSCSFSGTFSSNGTVGLRSAVIGGDLNCSSGTFSRTGIAIDGNLARITGGFDLRRAKWMGVVRFQLGRCGAFALDPSEARRGGLIMKHAKCDVLVDRPSAWTGLGSYDIEGFRYSYIQRNHRESAESRAKWLKHTATGWSPECYEHLANVLRLAGHGQDAKYILIAREKARPLPTAKLLVHRAYGVLVGYGHESWRALIGLGILWLAIGWPVVWYGDQNNVFFRAMDRVYVDQSQQRRTGFEMPKEYPRLEPFFYSLDVLVPFLDLNQRKYWLPDRRTSEGEVVQLFLWIYSILGWALATLGVVAVTGLVKRN